jgi:hypothetical protein
MIKVRIPLKCKNGPAGENIWVKPLKGNLAEVCNIPFFAKKVSLGDVVEIIDQEDDFPVVGKVVKKVTKSYAFEYSRGGTPEQCKENYTAIVDYLTPYDIKVEGACPGILSVAVPVKMRRDRLDRIMEDCPNILED